MRRPLVVELGANDRLLARRWAITSASLYWVVAIAIVAALLASSRAEKVNLAANAEQKVLVQDHSSPRLYGSLPN